MFFIFCKHTVRFTAAPCYHPVMAESSKYTKPTLRENIKKRIMASSKGGPPGKWSARKSQLLVQRYEKAGGGYRGGKSKKAKKNSTWISCGFVRFFGNAICSDPIVRAV